MIGAVADENKNPVESASVWLLQAADSTLIKIEVCDQAGVFRFNGLKAGRYLIRITSLGYQPYYYGPFQFISSQKSFDVGQFILSPGSTALDEVKINEQQNFIETKPGRVVLNIQNSILSGGNTAFDILKAAPGVQLDAEDNIRLNGKQNVLVMLNGKQTYMEREAVIDILKSTQSSEIDRIELISNPSARFAAEGSGAIINIISKKNEFLGANGSVTGMGGMSRIASSNEPNFRFNSGINLNYRNKAINLFGSYTYADINQSLDIFSDRKISSGQLSAINVDYSVLTGRKARTYRLGADVNLAPKHVVGVLFRGSDNNLQFDKSNNSAIFGLSGLDSTIQTQSDQNRSLNSQIFNVNYKGNLGDNAGELSFDFDYLTYQRTSLEFLTNNFLDADSFPYRPGLLLKNSSPSKFYVRSAKLDYAVPITKQSKLEIGLQGSRARGNSQLDFGPVINGVFYPDTEFISQFLIDEQIGAAYANYSINFGKADLTLGLRAEKTISEGTSVLTGAVNNRNYLNLFPNLQYAQEVDKDNSLLFSYSRRITRPGYDNLNPFIAYLDQYSYRSGNPFLKPEFSRIAEVAHVYKNKFTTTLRVKVIDDLIIEFNEQDELTNVNTVISRNLDRQYLYGLEINAPVKLSAWWTANLNLQSAFEKYVAKTAGEDFVNTSPSLILSMLQSLKLKENFSAEISGKYETATIYGIYNYQAAYTVDAAVAKSLFKKNATIRLRVSDVFNTARNRYSSTFQDLQLSYRDKRDSRLAQLSFSYLFGRRTVKASRTRDTASDSEQERIGH